MQLIGNCYLGPNPPGLPSLSHVLSALSAWPVGRQLFKVPSWLCRSPGLSPLGPIIQCPQTTFLLTSSPVCPVADCSSPGLSSRKLILQLSKSKCMISTPHSLNSVIATKVYPAAHARKPRVVLNLSISLPIQALSIPPPKHLPTPSAALYSQDQQPGPSHQHVPRGALVFTLARFL